MNIPENKYIFELIEKSPNYFDRQLKKEYKEWCDYIRTIFSGKIFNESLYKYLHGADCNMCQTCGNPSKWVGIKQGFNKYCTRKCGVINPETISRRNATVVEKHGSLETARSVATTNRQKTMISRYGVAHALQKKEFKEKAKSTLVENFGEAGFANQKITNKRKATTMNLYGVGHVSALVEVKAKKASTNFERYGASTIVATRKVVEKTQEVRKSKATVAIKQRALVAGLTPLWVEYTKVGDQHKWKCKCGNEFMSHMDDGSTPTCKVCHPGGSKGETELFGFIKELMPDAEPNDRKIISPRELDILIPSKKIAIEYNGLYWHSEDKVGTNYHLEKTLACAEAGYQLIQIFESEWIENKELVKYRLRAKLGKNTTIFGRKTSVVTPTTSQTREFLDKNHIQGACQGALCLGLEYEEEIVALMTFGKSRYDKSIEWELIRFASKEGVTVVGGATKLLKHFEKTYEPKSLISYCDRRWNTGDSYLRMGFSLDRTSAPSYHYTEDGLVLHNRVKFQKHKLEKLLPIFDKTKTEGENMAINGFYKVWDCGTNVFIKHYDKTRTDSPDSD